MGFDPDLEVLEPVRCVEREPMTKAIMGPIELLRRALKLLRDNPAMSMWVQITSVLPMTIVNLLIAIKAFSSITQPFQRLLTQGGPLVDTFHPPNPGVAFLLCVMVFALKINLLGTVLFTVGSLHQGKVVTIAEVLQSQPRLWKGLAIIQSWGIVFDFGTVFIISFVFTVFTSYFFPSEESLWRGIVGAFVFMAQKFFLTALFQVANGVTSFEGTYGPAAIKKGWWLLKGRWKVALGLFVLLIIPRILVDYLILTAGAGGSALQVHDTSSYVEFTSVWRRRGLWLMFVISVIVMSLLVQITVMSWALFFVSCKVYHHDGFFFHSDSTPASDYELIVNQTLVDEFASPV